MQDIEYGYCHCGCGEKTKIASRTKASQHQRKGEPNRFLAGHRFKKHPDYVKEDRGYVTPCWIWQGAKDWDGYGLLRRGGQSTGAHIWYYKRAKGSIPEGTEIDHLCSIRPCVNPDHLEATTHTENVRRGRWTKLTAEAVREIRATPKTYGSRIALARKFGVHPDTIRNVRSGHRWSL